MDATGVQGPPRWDWNASQLTHDLLPEGAVGFETQSFALLQLVEDPMCDAYRVEAELRHCTHGRGDSFVGLYFGLDNQTAGDRTPFARMFFVQFSDYWATDELADPKAAAVHRVRMQDLWIVREANVFDPVTVELSGQSAADLRFQPAADPVLGNVWRKLALDVSPQGVRVTWVPDPRNPQPATTDLPVATLDKGLRSPALHRATAGGAVVRPRPWAPRRPIGIVASSAAVAFRNVEITPRTGAGAR